MANCSVCGEETQLYIQCRPVCVKYDETREQDIRSFFMWMRPEAFKVESSRNLSVS